MVGVEGTIVRVWCVGGTSEGEVGVEGTMLVL